MITTIKNPLLEKQGYIAVDFPLEAKVLELLNKEAWKELDQYFIEISKPGGSLRTFLDDYLEYNTLEHIIAIRRPPDDEDGIWHDDGSRFLGFSLSLNRDHENIVGGELRFREKQKRETKVFPAQVYGRIILFLSGLYGYEHMVSAVTQGERIVIAGWCS